MKPREFALLVERDGGCVHCGEQERLAPNHRINRGMGGVSKTSRLHLPSNLVILCSVLNGLIESDTRWQTVALTNGWKLNRWQIPEDEPFFHVMSNQWRKVDDYYSYTVIEREE